MPTAALTTADELLHLRLPGKRTELVHGRLVVREPAGFRHGAVVARLTRAIAAHADEFRLGIVVAAETGFTLRRHPDTVRAADVAFVSRDRAPDPDTAGFAELTPDLVVEVLSPGDRPSDTLQKCGDWLSAGCKLVWIIDPVRRLARVYRADGGVALLGSQDSLDGEEVLPGLCCPLASVLD